MYAYDSFSTSDEYAICNSFFLKFLVFLDFQNNVRKTSGTTMLKLLILLVQTDFQNITMNYISKQINYAKVKEIHIAMRYLMTNLYR